VVLATLAVVAVVVLSWPHGGQQETQSLEAASTLTLPDRVADYQRARATFEQSLRGRDDAGLRGALALVEAHLFSRYQGVERKQVDARLGKGHAGPLGGLARALLHLHDRQIARAAQVLRGIPADAGGWHRRYVALRLAVAEGRLDTAGQLLVRELQQPRPSPAVVLLGARLNRLRGDSAASLRLLEAGTRVWPEHPGLRIERALLAAQRGTTPGAAATEALQRAAGKVPRYCARLALLEGHAAWAAKRAREAIAAADRARATDPRDPEAAWQAVAWRVMSRQNIRESADLMDAAVQQIQIFQPDARLWQAQALLLLNRPRQARLALGKIPAARLTGSGRRWLRALQVDVARQLGQIPVLCSPDSGLRGQVACAEALLERSRLEPARKVIDRISHPGARAYLMGLQALAKDEVGTAIRRLHDAKDLPDPVAPLLALANAHQRKNELPDAVAALRRALDLEPASVGVRFALARGLAAAGHLTEARVHLARVFADRPTEVGTLVDLGKTCLDLRDVDRARAVARMASTHHPQAAAVQILAGRVALADGEPKRARQLFAVAFKRDPDLVVALTEMARAAVALGHAGQAQAEVDRALKLRPDEPEVLLGAALAYIEMGRFREAHNTGVRGVWLWRERNRQWRSSRAMLDLGHRLRKGDDWARARGKELLFEACIVKGAPAVAFLALGRVYREEDDRPRAIWCYRRAVALDPELAEAHRQLAKLLDDPNQAERARRRHLELESRDRTR
jgi:tetratricopeptide (TPR) repeat protein